MAVVFWCKCRGMFLVFCDNQNRMATQIIKKSGVSIEKASCAGAVCLAVRGYFGCLWWRRWRCTGCAIGRQQYIKFSGSEFGLFVLGIQPRFHPAALPRRLLPRSLPVSLHLKLHPEAAPTLSFRRRKRRSSAKPTIWLIAARLAPPPPPMPGRRRRASIPAAAPRALA
jgi:hypothetical protein